MQNTPVIIGLRTCRYGPRTTSLTGAPIASVASPTRSNSTTVHTNIASPAAISSPPVVASSQPRPLPRSGASTPVTAPMTQGMKTVIMAGASRTETRCRHHSRRRAMFEPLSSTVVKEDATPAAHIHQRVLKYAPWHGGRSANRPMANGPAEQAAHRRDGARAFQARLRAGHRARDRGRRRRRRRDGLLLLRQQGRPVHRGGDRHPGASAAPTDRKSVV